MLENILQYSNLLQIGLTVAFLYLCVKLFDVWGPSYRAALRKVDHWKWWKTWMNRNIWTSEEWLVVGIVSGFAGNFLDNVYWGVSWAAVYLDLPASHTLIDVGPVVNMFVRQGIGIWAVFCHLIAAQMMNDKETRASVTVPFLIGAAFIVGLLTLGSAFEPLAIAGANR